MARGFGSTHGVGLTDLVTSALVAASPTARTWAMVADFSSVGNAAFARAMIRDNAGTEESSIALPDGPAHTSPLLSFRQRWTGGLAEWTWTTAQEVAPTVHRLVITYDLGSAANDPAVYWDSTTPFTVGSGLTEATAPSGSVVNNAVALLIGNRAAQDRVTDGIFAEVAEASRIWTAEEIGYFMAGYPPRYYAAGLTEYFRFLGGTASEINSSPTVVGTADQTHPATKTDIVRRLLEAA